MIEVTRLQARRYVLSYQGLLGRPLVASRHRVVEFVRRVGCIQFDPLSIVARNPDLVLQSRFSRYTEKLLEKALYGTRELIDGWDKVASIIPVENWPYFERIRELRRRWIDNDHSKLYDVMPEVKERVTSLGAASWNEVRLDRTIDWSWGRAEIGRAALDAMYQTGELVVHHRVGTRKYYAPAHEHIPDSIRDAPDPHPDDEAYHDWRVERRVRSVGILPNRSGDAWQIDNMKAPERAESIDRLVASGRIIPVRAEGVEPILYIPSDQIEEITRKRRVPSNATARFIAPLDNVMWDRRLISELFDFHYRWEVYTPAKKRKYGYYVLPVLVGDRFVARCEPVFDRKHHVLEIRGWWWENGFNGDITAIVAACETESSESLPSFERTLSKGIEAFARFLGAERVRLSDSELRT